MKVSVVESTLSNALNLIRCSSGHRLLLTIEYDVATLSLCDLDGTFQLAFFPLQPHCEGHQAHCCWKLKKCRV